MNPNIVLLTVGLALLAGCAHREADTRPPQPSIRQPAALTEAQILVIARQAVATNDTWLERAEFATPKQRPDGSWSVLVWRLPKTPGGYRVISISEQGQVTGYFRGH
jgi:hypothetical protein